MLNETPLQMETKICSKETKENLNVFSSEWVSSSRHILGHQFLEIVHQRVIHKTVKLELGSGLIKMNEIFCYLMNSMSFLL